MTGGCVSAPGSNLPSTKNLVDYVDEHYPVNTKPSSISSCGVWLMALVGLLWVVVLLVQLWSTVSVRGGSSQNISL